MIDYLTQTRMIIITFPLRLCAFAVKNKQMNGFREIMNVVSGPILAGLFYGAKENVKIILNLTLKKHKSRKLVCFNL